MGVSKVRQKREKSKVAGLSTGLAGLVLMEYVMNWPVLASRCQYRA